MLEHLDKFSPEAITILAVVAAGLLVLFLCGQFRRIPRQIAPALMTSLGILGTFVGIHIALSSLKSERGGETVVSTADIFVLINGMQTAFATSLLGLASAILSRFVWSWSWSPHATKPEPSPEQEQILGHLNAIKMAIAGNGDASLSAQIQNLREESREGFNKMDGLADTIRDALVTNLEKLMDDLRDIIGKQLGEQLSELITNIEEALIKQFGKTFVEFNEAVQALKRWQEDHRQHVEQLTAAFEQAAQGIEKIRDDCAKIPLTMENLRVVVEAAVVHTENLNERLNAFADMKKQAEESFPAIKENLDSVGRDLAASAKGLNDMEVTIRDAFAASKRETENIVKQHTAEVDKVVGNMREKMEQAQRDIAGSIEGALQEASQKFAEEMNSEVDRIAREWGGNLVSIADRCAETIRAVEQSSAHRQ